MDLNELKENWKNVNERLSALENKEASRRETEMYHNRRTAQDRLVCQYTRLCYLLSILGMVYIFRGIFSGLPHGGLTLANGLVFPWWMLVIIGVFCAVAALYAHYLARGVRSIDVWNMSVMEVSRRAMRYRRLHHLWILYAMPLAIALVWWMLWIFRDSEEAVTGGIIGGIIGLALGTAVYFRIMKNYRSLIRPDDIPLV